MNKVVKQTKWLWVTLIFLVGIGLVWLNFKFSEKQTGAPPADSLQLATPTQEKFGLYAPPSLPAKEAYTIIIAGDSMVKSLGPNSDRLREYLKEYYPQTVFGIFNYGFAASNILSLEERLNKDTTDEDMSYQAILNRQFDILIVESFGHNPLSDLPLETGLQAQTKVLGRTMNQVTSMHPESMVVFLAVMAPNKENYGKNTLDLNLEQRKQWAEERMAYIENHIRYANEHSIPLVNVYERSLKNGDGNLDYINQDDFIHPSANGVELISSELAEFLYTSQIIPKAPDK